MLPPLLQPGTPVSTGEVEHREVTDSHCSVLRADARTEQLAAFDHSVLGVEAVEKRCSIDLMLHLHR